MSGTFSPPAQRKVYDAVLEASDAVFAIARPGIRFRELHATAMEVVARHLADWGGLLPGSAEESLLPDNQWHRRWMVHGTSHHLGMDVHDCAQARREMYLDAELVPGMVFTIEPGLYFKQNDLLAPEELRGIGVRIEDDVLVTADGVENLSKAAPPRRADDVEAWIASLRGVSSTAPPRFYAARLAGTSVFDPLGGRGGEAARRRRDAAGARFGPRGGGVRRRGPPGSGGSSFRSPG